MEESGDAWKSRSLSVLDAFALAGTVASTAAVVVVGVAEAPIAALALPVVLPMVALLASRERQLLRDKAWRVSAAASAKREVELRQLNARIDSAVAESVTRALSSDVDAMFKRLEGSLSTVSEATREAADRLDASGSRLAQGAERAALASGERTAREVRRAMERSRAELVGAVSRAAAEVDLEGIRDVVEASARPGERAVRDLEVAMSDVKQELASIAEGRGGIAQATADAVLPALEDSLMGRVMEAAAFRSQSLPGQGTSVELITGSAGDSGVGEWWSEESAFTWLRDELREAIAADFEVALQESRAEQIDAMRKSAEEVISHVMSHADKSERALSQLIEQSGTRGDISDEGLEDLRDDLQALSQDMSKLQSNLQFLESLEMEQLKALPSLVERVSEDVSQTLRQYEMEVSTFQGQVAKFTSRNVDLGAGMQGMQGGEGSAGVETGQLERKIDQLAESTLAFEGISSQLQELNSKLGALAEAPPSTLQGGGAVEIGAWLDYEKPEGGGEDGEKEAVSQRVPASSSFKPSLGVDTADVGDEAAAEESPAEFAGKVDDESGESSPELPPGVKAETGTRADVDALLQKGLTLLKEGRALSQDVADTTSAESYFRQALECFRTAAKIDEGCIAAFGNEGNTLLAYARLKKGLLDALLAAEPAGTQGALDAAAEDLARDASGFLTEAGRCFRRVLSLDGRDARALLNWGNALCLRASLVEGDAANAFNLYDAAIEKFEAALRLEPGMGEALRAAGTALADISWYQESAARRASLEGAASYIGEALRAYPGDRSLLYLLEWCEEELDGLDGAGR